MSSGLVTLDVMLTISLSDRHDYSYRPGDTHEDVVKRQKHLPPAWELREQWSYNNQVCISEYR